MNEATEGAYLIDSISVHMCSFISRTLYVEDVFGTNWEGQMFIVIIVLYGNVRNALKQLFCISLRLCKWIDEFVGDIIPISFNRRYSILEMNLF